MKASIINRRDNSTISFWGKAHSAEKFQENGLWGLKSPTGEIVLEPKYDQIEFCADFFSGFRNFTLPAGTFPPRLCM